jgi:hypothetical protein
VQSRDLSLVRRIDVLLGETDRKKAYEWAVLIWLREVGEYIGRKSNMSLLDIIRVNACFGYRVHQRVRDP